MSAETPTTGAIETAWADRADFLAYVAHEPRSGGDEARYREQFRGWLAEHDREVRADTLDRAAKKLRAMADEVEASGRDDLEERTIVEVTRDDASLLERQAAQIREGGAS